MEPYVSEEADEEGRPEAAVPAPEQHIEPSPPPPPPRPPPPQTVPVLRREQNLPVRFASPVTGPQEGSRRRTRPDRQSSRDQLPPERWAHERRGRGSSPFLGERQRQTSSPSPIASHYDSRRLDGEERSEGPREGPRRRTSPLIESPNRSSRARTRDSQGFLSDEDTAYIPSHLGASRLADEASGPRQYTNEYVREAPIASGRAREIHEAAYESRSREQPSTRPFNNRGRSYAEDYEDEDWPRPDRPDLETWPRSRVEAVEPAYLRRPMPFRGASRHESSDEWEGYQGSRNSPVRFDDRPTRPSRYQPPYYEEMPKSSYLIPALSYRSGGYYPPLRRRSTTHDREDFPDVRRRRDRSPRYPDYGKNTFSPMHDDYYRSGNYRRPVSPPPPPPPITLKKAGHHDADYSDWYPSRRHQRSRSPPLPPSAAAPIVINNRIYDDREAENDLIRDDERETLSIRPLIYSERQRDRSRSKFHSYGSVPIQSRVSNNYYSENYDPPPGQLSEPDLGYAPEAYQFTLSRHSKSLRGTDSILSSVSDLSDTSENNEPRPKSPPKLEPESGSTCHVLQSKYTGDGVIGGSHAVQLTLNSDVPSNVSKGVASVFRWVHFEDKNMDFDNFEHNTLNIAGLTETETAAISKMLGRAKKGYDKPLQMASKGKTRFMVPSFLQENLVEEKRPSSSKARTVSWICAPYFCLAKYGTASGLKASSHPMRTLLQARFALAQKERDMKQAVCYLPDTPPGHCFHIAQAWFIILDDFLLVSCARTSMKSVLGDYISILPKVEPQPSSGLFNILVSTKNSLLWSIPSLECQSWFGFVSHFCDYWPLEVEARYKDKLITASEWPRILALAKKTTVRLLVDFRQVPSILTRSKSDTSRAAKQSEPAKGVLLYGESSKENVEGNLDLPETGGNPISEPLLRPVDQRRPSRSKKQSTDQANVDFHVFTWINSQNPSRDASSAVSAVNVDSIVTESESQGVDEDLVEIDTYLSSKTSLSHRLTYNRCHSTQSSERSKLYDLIAGLKPDALSTEEQIITRYENMVGVLNAAEVLFRFFLPPDSQAPSTSKYWGALFLLLKSLPPASPARSRSTPSYYTQSDSMVSELLNWLERLNKATSPFKDYLTHVPLPDRNDIQISDELTTAWLHLVLAFASSAADEMGVLENQMSICYDLVIRGIRKTISNISKVELSEYTVFLPFEFASLISFQLSRDHEGTAANISDTYLEYLKTLQSDIEGNPLDRGHQDRIVCLKQEIEVISETLDAQLYVLRQAQRGFAASHGGPSMDIEYPDAGYSRRQVPRTSGGHILYTDPAGVQSLIIQDNLALVENQIRGFREMREIASELGDWNIQKIDSNKDRQEAAIYAFTIVTIIFLPLGTVAGIMGMNTSDIRDMPHAQWVYWATALPLTILVIAICLAWAGELNNFQAGFKNMWRRTPPSYVVIKDRYEGTGRRERFDERVYNAPLRRSRTVYGNKESYV